MNKNTNLHSRRIETLVKNLNKIQTDRGTCGFRKKLITSDECSSVAISHLDISDAKKHYHKKTTEFYYVLSGTGEIELNDEKIPIKTGTIVMINPGVVHRAIPHENLKVLVIMTPPTGETEDQFYV